VVDIIFERSLE